MKTIRLDKYLTDCGCGTRSEMKRAVRQGLVTVNDIPAADSSMKLTPGTDIVKFQGRTLHHSQFQYIMFHKPAGCVTAVTDQIHKTVMDYLPSDLHKNMAPAGRLNLDTEGLLLITDDGALVHRLLSPAHHVTKTYIARVNGPVTDHEIKLFFSGLDIGEEKTTRPALLKIFHSASEESEVSVTVTEGKFHQIKRMFQAVGLSVLYLKRISMGSLTLDESLPPGAYRMLTEEEIKKLKE
ncbi:Ribosomal small subunit pseudouridine synthase A [uncultured Roseburia sp.]|uniref:rRNA pseudouridine synthase n=1 Tax=Brotonthovivens ammoniilytica TaxID=2981725 RepID=A0ABT2TGH0_9FIRM|nr:pseudouridine synthase [Brotonthovivens ammoniilytica]MCU6761272.1 rRNA pseudouridine synthase [Brotonthovivens ammoniilytica]SCI23939.1 Ribosomal small subunit pseudouridine synthase A [uncultured Roseburia sp.]